MPLDNIQGMWVRGLTQPRLNDLMRGRIDKFSLDALNASTGALLWTTHTGSTISSTPTIANGVVYVSCEYAFCALNAATGAELWSSNIFVDSYSSAAVAKGMVYIGASVAGQHGSFTGTLYALNAYTGKIVWSAPVASGITSSPTVANGVVYVGTDDGTLYAFNAKIGAELVAVAGVAGQSSPTVANGVVYSETTVSGELFALGAP